MKEQKKEKKMEENRNEFINKNIKLVFFVIKNHFNYKSIYNLRLTRDDLFQQGKLGLIEASIRYNKEKGKFSTFAYKYIKNYITKLIHNNYKHISNIDNVDNVDVYEDIKYIDFLIDLEKCCKKCLNDFQIKIIYEYIFEGYTFEEIANKNNLNGQMNAIREYKSSMRKLKKYIEDENKKCI